MYIGKYSDPFFIYEIFKVEDHSQIDRNIGEDAIFADVENSPYLNALYNIINQIRYQRQPFIELQFLFEGEIVSE